MHAMTLESMKDHLPHAKKAIDIGTGSGYLAACFAELMPDDSKVYMVDHINEIVKHAFKNIAKENKHLIKKNKIVCITKDARKGVPEYAPYDVIHVGGAVDHVS